MGRLFRGLGLALFFLVTGLCLAITIVPPFLDRLYYKGPISDHYDGERFVNPDGDDILKAPGGGSRGSFLLRWISGSDDRAVWPDHVAVTPAKPEPRVEGNRMVATWIGHATVLVQTQGLNILTDPIWSKAAGPFGIGPGRVAAPGVRLADLPKIDLILVSHNHYDHMDLATIKQLWVRDHPRIVTSLGNETLIKSTGAAADTRDWGGRISIRADVEVIVTRNHHWGSRWGTDTRRALWSSFVVKLPGGNLFFAGDTGFGDGKWPLEARQYGPVRLALLPIGAFRFRPGQMDIGSHMGPIQSAEVFSRLGATRGIAIHWGTFQLSSEAYDTPPRMLAEVMKCRGLPTTGLFDAVRIGAPVDVPALAPPPVGHAPDQACLTASPITSLK